MYNSWLEQGSGTDLVDGTVVFVCDECGHDADVVDITYEGPEGIVVCPACEYEQRFERGAKS